MTISKPPPLYECERCHDVYRWCRTKMVYVPPRARPDRPANSDVPFLCPRCERDGSAA